VCRRVLQGILPGADGPFAPRRDDPQAGVQGLNSQLKAHLVVALARAPVRHRIRALQRCDFHHALGDEGPRKRGTQQVLPLVDGSRFQCREDIFVHELAAQVLDIDLACAAGQRLRLQPLQFLSLAQICRETDDFAVIVLAEPGHDHRGIQTPGVGQYALVHRTHSRSS